MTNETTQSRQCQRHSLQPQPGGLRPALDAALAEGLARHARRGVDVVHAVQHLHAAATAVVVVMSGQVSE